MRVFICLLDPDGRGIGEAVRTSYESLPRSRGLSFRWQCFDRAAVLLGCDEPYGDTLIAASGRHLAVGVARLDNREEVRRLVGAADPADRALTDLELALHAFIAHGSDCVARLLGDFAFVVWDPTKGSAVAVCDALAVRKIYLARRDGLTAFASHAEALARGDRYNVQFLAEEVAGAEADPELTVYDGVSAVPAGTIVRLEDGRLTSRRYWSPEDVASGASQDLSEEEATATLRNLFIEAVRCRLGPGGTTWAQLSGGLDSSSVVSVAQWLVEEGAIDTGLSGTVTYVDREGTPADERAYSDLVVSRWGIRNETIVDPPMWYDERYGPPRLDQPRPNMMFYPREGRLAEIVRGAGGRVLLTGQGPDEYLRGSMFFFADWIAQGRIREALREMLRWAAIGRVSFWELAYRNAVVPLIPGTLQRWIGPAVAHPPVWVRPEIDCRYDLSRRHYELALSRGPVGAKYQHSTLRSVVGLAKTVGHLLLDEYLDVRHPFLDRRLVEFGIRLPPYLTTRPNAGKWVLREAVHGILPEAVRTRIGKGTQNERHAWSLTAQRSLLEPLVTDSILAEIGVVDRRTLRTAFNAAPEQAQRRGDPHAALQQVLAVEAWLQIRAGRWPRGLSH